MHTVLIWNVLPPVVPVYSMVGNSDIQGMEHCILVYALPLQKVGYIGQK